MKKAIVGGLMLLSAVFSAQSASALTVEEYNGLNTNTQNVALSRIVSGTFQSLAQNGASAEKLQCIRQFFTQQEINVGGDVQIGIPGVHAVLDQIDLANNDKQLSLRVEDLVLGTINTHCDGVDVANTPDAPVTTPPEPVPTPG